jgi:amidase
MCRTVRDAAILLGALTGIDANDIATAAARESRSRITPSFSGRRLRGARIGVLRKHLGSIRRWTN